MGSRLRRPIVTAAAVALTLGIAAGCSSSSSGGGDQTVNPGNSPSSSGKPLVVALDASYAPNESFDKDGKTIIGMDADLANAIGQQLGRPVKLTNETFDDILAGIQTGKYDLAMSSFTDTLDREKVVDFVDYFKAGTSFYTAAQGGVDLAGLADLCGKKVAVEKGTTQQTDAEAQSKKCPGGSSVTVDTFNDQNGANLAIQSGHDQIGMGDSPVAAYIVAQSNGVFKLVGTPYGVAPYGIGIKQGSPLVQQVNDAVKALIDNGTYDTIMKKYGIEAGEITAPTINGATS